jgi:hypothetical protein
MRKRLRVLIVGALVVGIAACDGSDSKDSGRAAQAAAATAVVEQVRPGRMQGFDPAVWRSIPDKATVLPPGARLQVVPGSFVGNRTSATVDAVISNSGPPDQRAWVFLRKVRGDWLIYGTLPLGGKQR